MEEEISRQQDLTSAAAEKPCIRNVSATISIHEAKQTCEREVTTCALKSHRHRQSSSLMDAGKGSCLGTVMQPWGWQKLCDHVLGASLEHTQIQWFGRWPDLLLRAMVREKKGFKRSGAKTQLHQVSRYRS